MAALNPSHQGEGSSAAFVCPHGAACLVHGDPKEEPVQYDPHVFTREDGSQILVSIYGPEMETGATVMTVAERPEPGATWGPPIDEDRDWRSFHDFAGEDPRG